MHRSVQQETVLLYAEAILKNWTYEGYLMRPLGAVADELKSFEFI